MRQHSCIRQGAVIVQELQCAEVTAKRSTARSTDHTSAHALCVEGAATLNQPPQCVALVCTLQLGLQGCPRGTPVHAATGTAAGDR
jgi:hypothetical protein